MSNAHENDLRNRVAALRADNAQIKAHMLELEDDKDALMDSMESLRAERDALKADNARLTQERDRLATALLDLCDAIPDTTLADDPPLGAWVDIARAALAALEPK